jgi:hypothetical protein
MTRFVTYEANCILVSKVFERRRNFPGGSGNDGSVRVAVKDGLAIELDERERRAHYFSPFGSGAE